MSMPTITEECVHAVIEKATQDTPETFAASFLQDLHDTEQVAALELLRCILSKCPEDEPGLQTVILCSVGVFWKLHAATLEAIPMNEAWSTLPRSERVATKKETTAKRASAPNLQYERLRQSRQNRSGSFLNLMLASGVDLLHNLRDLAARFCFYYC